MALVACAACCSSCARESPATSVVLSASPELRIAKASSIARVEISAGKRLTWWEDGREVACGFLHEARAVDRLRGPGHTTFLAGDQMLHGQHYLVTLLNLEGQFPPGRESTIDDRDRAYLECRKQVPRYVTGWARFEGTASDRLIVKSSKIIPEEVRRSAIGGTVDLAAIKDYVRSTRYGRVSLRRGRADRALSQSNRLDVIEIASSADIDPRSDHRAQSRSGGVRAGIRQRRLTPYIALVPVLLGPGTATTLAEFHRISPVRGLIHPEPTTRAYQFRAPRTRRCQG